MERELRWNMGFDSWADEVVTQVVESRGAVPKSTAERLALSLKRLGAQKLTQVQRKQLASALLRSLGSVEGVDQE